MRLVYLSVTLVAVTMVLLTSKTTEKLSSESPTSDSSQKMGQEFKAAPPPKRKRSRPSNSNEPPPYRPPTHARLDRVREGTWRSTSSSSASTSSSDAVRQLASRASTPLPAEALNLVAAVAATGDIKRACFVGFGGGEGAAAVLGAHDSVRVLAFDTLKNTAIREGAAAALQPFASRLKVVVPPENRIVGTFTPERAAFWELGNDPSQRCQLCVIPLGGNGDVYPPNPAAFRACRSFADTAFHVVVAIAFDAAGTSAIYRARSTRTVRSMDSHRTEKGVIIELMQFIEPLRTTSASSAGSPDLAERWASYTRALRDSAGGSDPKSSNNSSAVAADAKDRTLKQLLAMPHVERVCVSPSMRADVLGLAAADDSPPSIVVLGGSPEETPSRAPLRVVPGASLAAAVASYAASSPKERCDLIVIGGQQQKIDNTTELFLSLQNIANPSLGVLFATHTACDDSLDGCLDAGFRTAAIAKAFAPARQVAPGASITSGFSVATFRNQALPECLQLSKEDEVKDVEQVAATKIAEGDWGSPSDSGDSTKPTVATAADDMERAVISSFPSLKSVCVVAADPTVEAQRLLKRVSSQTPAPRVSMFAVGSSGAKATTAVRQFPSFVELGWSGTASCQVLVVFGSKALQATLPDFRLLQTLVDPRFHMVLVHDIACEATSGEENSKKGQTWCVDHPVVAAMRMGLLHRLGAGLSDTRGMAGTPSEMGSHHVYQFTRLPLPLCKPALRINEAGSEPDALAVNETMVALSKIVDRGRWNSVDLQYTVPVDAILYKERRRRWPKQVGGDGEGHSGELTQSRQLYTLLAKLQRVRTVCEIGFNMGNSATMWLLANPTAKVNMFDLFVQRGAPVAYQFFMSPKSAAYIKDAPGRLTLSKGSSLEQVPLFAATRPNAKCDLLSVDGGHTYDVALADIMNMAQLANPAFNVAFIDDTNCAAEYCVDEALAEAAVRGIVRPFFGTAEAREVVGTGRYSRGLTVFTFNVGIDDG